MTPQAAANTQTAMCAEGTLAGWRGGAVELLGRTRTILFVEDEAFVRRVTAEVLSAVGYRVLTAGNAAEAAEAYDLHCGDVDLLLTDVVLPGKSGRALAQKLKQANPRLKVLLVTGYGDQMEKQNADTGTWLAKPFSLGVLLRKVRQVLEQEDPPHYSAAPVKPACESWSLGESERVFGRAARRG